MYELPDKIDRETCVRLDGSDPLAHLRDKFALPSDIIYMDGNSLGPLPVMVDEKLQQVSRLQWGEGLVRSWSQADWIGAPQRLGALVAPLLGANAAEVIVGDSMSVNLFKLLVAACRLRPNRNAILTDDENFPSDLYVADSVGRMTGYHVRRVPAEDIVDSLDGQTAVVLLTHVNFKTAEMHDMPRITAAAHEAGALVLWNLAHSAGAVPLQLSAHEVDLAVGCGYKYLNGGPGAPSFVYVAERWIQQLDQPLCGWLGHADPFAFDLDYRPAPTLRRALCGTPPILSFAALEAALSVFDGVPMSLIRAKSVAMTECFIHLMKEHLRDASFDLASPLADDRRGSHVSFAFDHGYAAMQALIERGLIGDFREPNLMRFGITPLYLRFVDVWDAVELIQQVVHEEAWKNPRFQQRGQVT